MHAFSNEKENTLSVFNSFVLNLVLPFICFTRFREHSPEASPKSNVMLFFH